MAQSECGPPQGPFYGLFLLTPTKAGESTDRPFHRMKGMKASFHQLLPRGRTHPLTRKGRHPSLPRHPRHVHGLPHQELGGLDTNPHPRSVLSGPSLSPTAGTRWVNVICLSPSLASHTWLTSHLGVCFWGEKQTLSLQIRKLRLRSDVAKITQLRNDKGHKV